MPRKNQLKNSKTYVNDIKFVNIYLPASEKKKFNSWVEESEADLALYLDEIVSSGYKLSASWSDYNQCMQVSLTCTDSANVNHNLCMTSRAKNIYEALWLSLYKHLVYRADQPWSDDVEPDVWG